MARPRTAISLGTCQNMTVQQGEVQREKFFCPLECSLGDTSRLRAFPRKSVRVKFLQGKTVLAKGWAPPTLVLLGTTVNAPDQ